MGIVVNGFIRTFVERLIQLLLYFIKIRLIYSLLSFAKIEGSYLGFPITPFITTTVKVFSHRQEILENLWKQEFIIAACKRVLLYATPFMNHAIFMLFKGALLDLRQILSTESL